MYLFICPRCGEEQEFYTLPENEITCNNCGYNYKINEEEIIDEGKE